MNVRKIRQDYGWSIPIVAAILNVSKSTVVRWEAGTHEPVGLARVVLEALAAAALRLSPEGRERVGGEMRLGIGGFLFRGLLGGVL